MTTHVALLRGINVGGRRKVPMSDLRGLFGELGLGRPRTYIQSGNVVFEAEEEREALARRLSAAMGDRFGFPIPVVLRTSDELRGTVERVPFTELERVFVAFLDRAPDPAALARLEPDRSPPDRHAVVGADVYLDLVNGAARTKLTNDWLDRRLGAVSTARNWRTVLALAEMAGASLA